MIFEKYELLVCDCFYDVLAICGKEEKLSGTTSLTIGSIAYLFNILHNLKGLMYIRQPISLQYIRKKLRTKKSKPTPQNLQFQHNPRLKLILLDRIIINLYSNTLFKVYRFNL